MRRRLGHSHAAGGSRGNLLAGSVPARASSHMDAPLITLDDAANTTDVYAFVSQRLGRKYLTTALAVYPHEEPGIGPNKYNFDDNVLYEIRVATGADAPAAARPSATSSGSTPRSETATPSCSRTSASSTPSVTPSQNLIQRYTVTKVDRRTGRVDVARTRHRAAEQPGHRDAALQPGRQRRKPGQGRRGDESDLDPYTAQSIAELSTAIRHSQASATTASTPMSRRCSIC